MNVASNRISGFGAGLQQFLLALVFTLFCIAVATYAALPSNRSVPSLTALAATLEMASNDASHEVRYFAPTQAKEGRNRLPSVVGELGDSSVDGAPTMLDAEPRLREQRHVVNVLDVRNRTWPIADGVGRSRAPPAYFSAAG